MAGVTGSIPVAPTIAQPQSLVRFLLPLFTRLRACRVLRPAHAGRRRRLQSRRDAAAGRRRRQGPHGHHGLSRAGAVVLRHRGPAAAGCAARRGRGVDRQGGRGVEQALPRPDRRRPAARGRPALQHRHRHPSRRDPGRRARRPTCRTTASSTKSATSCRAPTSSSSTIKLAGHDGAVRHRHAVPLDRHRCPSPSMSRSARTSGCRCRRRAMRRSPARRCWSTCRPATSPSARPRRGACCAAASRRARIAAYAYSASGPGESTTDLAWDGHAAIYECGDQLVEIAALREGLDHRHAPTSISAASARSGCATTASPTAR